MDNTNITKEHNIKFFYILIALVVFFTTGDLICSFSEKLTLASICSVTSGLIVFVGSYLKKKDNIEKGINDKIDYICNNFNLSNIILSICDIICSIIALFTGILIIGMIFRWAFAIRLIVTINKVKTVSRAFLLVIFGYLSVRMNKILSKIKENFIMKKFVNGVKTALRWIYANKKSICGTVFATFSGVISGITTNADLIAELPKLMFLDINWTAVIIGILAFVGVEIGVIGKGFETIKEFSDRKKLEKEKKDAEKLEKQALKELNAENPEEKKDKEAIKLEKQAQKEMKIAEKEARKAEVKAKKEAEKQAKEEEKAKLDAETRAKIEEIKAKMMAEKKEEVVIEKPEEIVVGENITTPQN